MVPSLLGWVALMLGQAAGLLLVVVLLGACFAVDRSVYRRYALQDWQPMRLRLTLVAGASCLAAVAALAR